MLPRNVKWFAWLWVFSFLLAFPELFLMPPLLPPLPPGIRSGVVKLTIAGMFLLLVMLLPIFQLAVWGRKNWARWVLFLAFVLPSPLLFERHMFRSDHLPLTIYEFAGTLVEALSFYFLFTGDARPWFRAQNSK
jgi:hypothetical protein